MGEVYRAAIRSASASASWAKFVGDCGNATFRFKDSAVNLTASEWTAHRSSRPTEVSAEAGLDGFRTGQLWSEELLRALLENHTGHGWIATICTVSSAVASRHPNCGAVPPISGCRGADNPGKLL